MCRGDGVLRGISMPGDGRLGSTPGVLYEFFLLVCYSTLAPFLRRFLCLGKLCGSRAARLHLQS